MGIEGFLDIKLARDSSKIDDVVIQSSRPVFASQVFHGKTVNESLAMLPLLFSICGVAQACAGVRASEQALGIKVSGHTEQLRERLLDMETLREHFWRILLDWPILLEQQSQKKEMSGILKYQQDYRELLTGGKNPFLPEPDITFVETTNSQPIKELSNLLESTVFAMPPEKWLEIESIEKLQDWFESSNTIAARFIHRVVNNQWQNLGKNHIKGLFTVNDKKLDITKLEHQFKNSNFVKLPKWQSDCVESSSLTRVDSKLLNNIKQLWGNGLFSRLIARLTEMAQIVVSLLNNTNKQIIKRQGKIHDSGTGMVNAARGLLIHHVTIEAKVIKKYQILAPTEWNFHPQGVVAHSLVGLRGSDNEIKTQAEQIINAIDPCVAYKLNIV